ncbi:hypothetical protein D0Z62_08055 [Providencia rettgeri]|uniref:hypothetical protein n=1 Tax=Providencia rettgeri TaxID=587 RepID=UPI001012D7F4|nr:hypothetical protein [Providencia rettgeri]RXN73745.1 hypothetical protein D0Z62_08055 [Providencia rettgeri]
MNNLMSPPVENKHSNLHKTALCAQKYTRELKLEMQPLLNKLFTTYPKEAGRFIGLINEIELMTSATLAEIEHALKMD